MKDPVSEKREGKVVQASDVAAEMMKRLEETNRQLTKNPRLRKELEAQRQESLRLRRSAQIGALRSDWNAPKRHLLNSAKVEFSGEWGRKFSALKAKVGTGMLVALVGGRGPGKTQMAVELMKEATSQLRSAHFLTATEFFVAVKDTYNRESQSTERDVLARFKRYRMLVVDEVGKRGQTEWENNLLFELINSRYNAVLDTLLLDNNEPEKFNELIGPSLASRINETGGVVHCNWPSFRE